MCVFDEDGVDELDKEDREGSEFPEVGFRGNVVERRREER